MTKCRGANLEAGRFFLTDDNDENVSKIISHRKKVLTDACILTQEIKYSALSR